MADEVRHSQALEADLIADPELKALQKVENGLKQFQVVVETDAGTDRLSIVIYDIA